MDFRVVRVITILSIAVGGLILVFAAVLYLMQPWMLFHPVKSLATTPDQVGLAYEDVRIEVGDGKSIHAWYLPVSDSAITVLFCHGNAGNISNRLESANYLLSLGLNVLLFDYQGYGHSDGTPGEDEIFADGMAAYRWLRTEKRIPADRIVIFGRSLGGAVAVDVASKAEACALVLESTFSSVSDMAKHLFPYLPMNLLLRFRLDSESKIGSVKMPILMVHSPQDEIVPYQFGRKLFAAAPEPKTFVDISGGHNDRAYLHTERYVTALRQVIGLEKAEH